MPVKVGPLKLELIFVGPAHRKAVADKKKNPVKLKPLVL